MNSVRPLDDVGWFLGGPSPDWLWAGPSLLSSMAGGVQPSRAAEQRLRRGIWGQVPGGWGADGRDLQQWRLQETTAQGSLLWDLLPPLHWVLGSSVVGRDPMSPLLPPLPHLQDFSIPPAGPSRYSWPTSSP